MFISIRPGSIIDVLDEATEVADCVRLCRATLALDGGVSEDPGGFNGEYVLSKNIVGVWGLLLDVVDREFVLSRERFVRPPQVSLML